MEFWGLIEKTELNKIIKEAKRSCVNDALKRLKEFDPMNETFFKYAMPNDTPNLLIKKRVTTNKLLLKKREKELKKLLG